MTGIGLVMQYQSGSPPEHGMRCEDNSISNMNRYFVIL